LSGRVYSAFRLEYPATLCFLYSALWLLRTFFL
jgi:hypothetical protein